MKRLLLLVSLFGMIAQAVDPVKVKDVNGVEFTLDLIQKNALQRCKTFEPFLVENERIEGMEDGPIDFGKIPRSFITQANIQQLADIIANPEKIKKITESKRILELFQLADYAMAPKKIVHALGQDAKIVIAERVTQLDTLAALNEEQAAELSNLRVAEKARENGKFDVNALLRKIYKKPISNVSGLCKDVTLDLSYESTKEISTQKLQSLNGLQKLATDYRITQKIKLDNQDIEKVDLGIVTKKFPQLMQLSLKNNLIESISESQAIRKLEVDLTANPLKSITIEKPERCNYLTFKTDKPDIQVDFVQNRYSKIHTWLKSFWAKAKVAREIYLPSAKDCAYILGGAAVTIGSIAIINEFFERLDAAHELEKSVFLVNDQKIILADKVWDTVKGKTLIDLMQKYGQDTRIVTLKEVAHLLPPVLTTSYKDIFITGAKTGTRWASRLTALGSAAFCLLDMVCAFYNGDDGDGTHFSYNLQHYNIAKNPYRISVKMSDSSATVKNFPSNYTYNLFGKV